MLSDADKERARYHCGYMTVTVATSFAFGIPQLTETQFLIEDALTRVMVQSEFRVLNILDRLDRIECKIDGAVDELFARKVDGLEINLDQPDMLEKEYVRQASRLCDMLGVMPYPYSKRFRSQLGADAIGNVRVGR